MLHDKKISTNTRNTNILKLFEYKDSNEFMIHFLKLHFFKKIFYSKTIINADF